MGSDAVLWVKFGEDRLKADQKGIRIILSDPPTYEVGSCTDDAPNSRVQFVLTASKPRIWTIIKYKTSLRLICDGAEIFDIAFNEKADCKEAWDKNFEYFKIKDMDKATDEYREILPGEYLLSS